MVPYVIFIIGLTFQSKLNRQALWIFIIFYTASLFLHSGLTYIPVFSINIIVSALFVFALSRLSDYTLMIALLCITELCLAIIDLASYLTYNAGYQELYDYRWPVEQAVITTQWLALWCTDGWAIRLGTNSSGNLLHRNHNATRGQVDMQKGGE